MHNNPATFTHGNGVNFNLVIISCLDAVRIDETHGLSTYARSIETCQDADSDEYKLEIPKLIIKSKIMSQDAGTPENFIETGETDTFFTMRTLTDAQSSQGVIYRASAMKQNINF